MTIGILGSGAGSTAGLLMDAAVGGEEGFEIGFVAATKESAGILALANSKNLNNKVVRYDLEETFADSVLALVVEHNVRLLVLCGFLRLVPQSVLDRMGGRVINSHPSLLPKYGGKGMYGRNVHRAVLEAKEFESGVTFHWVTGRYDEGDIIHQESVPVLKTDTVETLESRVKEAEKEVYPVVVSKICRSME